MTGLQLFTLTHVAISLVGILAGLVVIFGFLGGSMKRAWNLVFLVTTGLTSVTGFFFPFHGMTPGIAIGILSLLIFIPALLAYRKGWGKTYIATTSALEFFNVLVLIAQLFQKVTPLHRLAPTGKEPIIAATQALVLLVFVAAAWISIRRSQFSIFR